MNQIRAVFFLRTRVFDNADRARSVTNGSMPLNLSAVNIYSREKDERIVPSGDETIMFISSNSVVARMVSRSIRYRVICAVGYIRMSQTIVRLDNPVAKRYF